MEQNTKSRHTNLVRFALFTALSSVLYVLESFLPFPVPGGKWGLSNFLVLYLAVNEGLKSSIQLAFSKSILGSILSGSIFSPGFFMGFFGSISSAVIQSLLAKFPFLSYVIISFFGMITNNLIQFVVGSYLVGSQAIFVLLPLVLALGSISAFVNAYLAKVSEKILSNI